MQTLYDKIWNYHKITEDIIYIDRQLIHEVTSPQAFEGIETSGRKVRNSYQSLAVADHNVPTDGSWRKGVYEKSSQEQVEALERNTGKHGIKCFSLGNEKQGTLFTLLAQSKALQSLALHLFAEIPILQRTVHLER